MDGSQTIAWVERRVDALTEAKIEARQATMRNTVEEARERLAYLVFEDIAEHETRPSPGVTLDRAFRTQMGVGS